MTVILWIAYFLQTESILKNGTVADNIFSICIIGSLVALSLEVVKLLSRELVSN